MDNYKRYLFDDRANEHLQLSQQGRNTYSFQGQESQEEVLIDANFDDEYKKEFLRNQIKSVQEKLAIMGFSTIGDLYKPANPDVEKTLKVLHEMITQRKQDIEFRNQVHDKISKTESDRLQLAQNLDRLTNAKRQLESDNQALQTKLKSLEKAQKEQLNKLVSEKEDLLKQAQKLQNRQAQFEHEIKQRDLEIQKLKEYIKKSQANRVYKNSLEVTQPLEQTGPSIIAVNGEHEFSQKVMKRWETKNVQLQRENEQMRENLLRINNELNEILAIRRDVFVKRRKIDFGDENVPADVDLNQMHQIKPELFKVPFEGNGKQTLQMLQENLQTFKEIMKKFDTQYELQLNEDEIEIEGEGGKIKACKNLTELFKNYNFIFEAQDKMINQIINKSQSLKKIDELNFNLNRFNRVLDDKQIDEVKKYLQDQKKYLDESKSEMDMIKKQFQLQLKKREEEKQIIQTKRQMLEETNEKFKENIRMLENASKQALQQLNQEVK